MQQNENIPNAETRPPLRATIRDLGEKAIRGIRTMHLGVVEKRIDRLDTKLATDEPVVEAIKATTQSIIDSKTPSQETRPVSPREIRAAEKASRNKRKALQSSLGQLGLAQTYGRPVGDTKGPFFRHGGDLATINHDPARISDIATPAQEQRLTTGRYTKQELRTERRATRKFSSLQEDQRQRIQKNTEQATHGDAKNRRRLRKRAKLLQRSAKIRSKL